MVKLRIREILKQRGITQAELARRLGVTPITVNGWATGRRLPSLEVLDRIADITSTPIIQFFAAARRPHSFPEASNKQQPIINQLIRNTLMKKLLLLLLMVVTTAVGSWAQTYTYEVASGLYKTEESELTSAGWSITVDPNAGYKGVNWAAPDKGTTWNGLQYGKSKAAINSVVFKSSDKNVFSGKAIKTVTAKISGNCDISVSVNGTSYITSENKTTASNSGTNQEYTFTGDEVAGEVNILLKYTGETGNKGKAIYLRSIVVEYEEAIQVDKSQPATKIDFSLDENVTYTEAQTLELSTDGRDKDGNMLPIHYLISNDVTADETSPVYTQPIIVDKSMTVSAWVAEGVEDIKAYKVEIPVVIPGDPVVKVNDKVINPESVLPYGTEVTIWSENATKLADEELVEYANPYTFTLTEDYLNTFMGVNGNETSVNTTDVILTLAKPELTATIGDVVVENGGVYHIVLGTELNINAIGAASVTYEHDGDNAEIAVENGKFALDKAGMYSINAVAGDKSDMLIFEIEAVEMVSEEKTATFDFDRKDAYGMTTYSGTSSTFESTVKDITEDGVKLAFSGNYRLYDQIKDKTHISYELRLAKGSGTLVFTSEQDIKSIKFIGNNVQNLTVFPSDATGFKFSASQEIGTESYVTCDEGVKKVGLKAGPRQDINKIEVTFGSYVPANPEKPVVDFDATSNIFKVTVKPGHHVWYRSYSYVPQNKARVAQGAENAEWEKLTESGDVKAEVPANESGVLHRYEFLSHNPVTKLQSDAVRYSVKADGSLSGVEDVEVENGVEAEYFNLQGVRVAAPLAPGLYIERRGDKAVKVRIN